MGLRLCILTSSVWGWCCWTGQGPYTRLWSSPHASQRSHSLYLGISKHLHRTCYVWVTLLSMSQTLTHSMFLTPLSGGDTHFPQCTVIRTWNLLPRVDTGRDLTPAAMIKSVFSSNEGRHPFLPYMSSFPFSVSPLPWLLLGLVSFQVPKHHDHTGRSLHGQQPVQTVFRGWA